MRKLALLVVALIVVSAGATGGTRKRVPPRRSGRHAAAKTRPASSGKKPATRKKAVPAVTWRNRQLAPLPERYREIQQALAAKGYLSAEEANGVWGASSIDALKRFQADQKFESSGKINSLSLIALGLGPKHETVPETNPAPAAELPESSR